MKSAAISPSTSMIRQMAIKPADRVERDTSRTALNRAADSKLPPISENTAKNAKIYTGSRRDDYFISRAALLKNIAYTRASSKPTEGAPEYASAQKQHSVMQPQYAHAAPTSANARQPVLSAAQAAQAAPEDGRGARQAEGMGASAAVEPGAGCGTCESRVYRDGSGDSGVSYQGAKGMPTSLSGVYVASHEGEHATRESAKAQKEGDVITQKKVTVEMACCPDCGRMYAAGGTTTISKMEKQDKQDEKQNSVTVQNAIDLLDPAGERLDMLI